MGIRARQSVWQLRLVLVLFVGAIVLSVVSVHAAGAVVPGATRAISTYDVGSKHSTASAISHEHHDADVASQPESVACQRALVCSHLWELLPQKTERRRWIRPRVV